MKDGGRESSRSTVYVRSAATSAAEVDDLTRRWLAATLAPHSSNHGVAANVRVFALDGAVAVSGFAAASILDRVITRSRRARRSPRIAAGLRADREGRLGIWRASGGCFVYVTHDADRVPAGIVLRRDWQALRLEPLLNCLRNAIQRRRVVVDVADRDFERVRLALGVGSELFGEL